MEQNKIEKDKKISIDKENPKFFKVLLVVSVITALISGIGGLALLIGISWLIGIIPVSILRDKMKNARITIYGIIFLLLCSLSIIGTLYSENDNQVNIPKTDKSLTNHEQIGNLYRNIKYNFRIKFPEGWDIKPGDGPNILQKAVKGNHTISIGVREIPAEYSNKTATIEDVMSIVEFKDTLLEGIQEKFSGAKLIDYGESKLDNNPTYWVKYTAPYTVLDITVQGTHLQYQTLNNNILYTISAGSTSDEFDAIEQEFMKSIATFVIENY